MSNVRLNIVKKPIIFASCILAVSSTFAQPSRDAIGSICGSVLDEKGVPASHVHIAAMNVSLGGHANGFPGSQTDESGQYCIRQLQVGEYILSADDRPKGYPPLWDSFFSWRTPDSVVLLTSQSPRVRLDWKIPFKAGFLRLDVPGSRTGSESSPITFRLVVRSRPQLGMTSLTISGQMEERVITFLLPPDEDVLLTVSSPGHQSWPEDGSDGMLLRLGSGATENRTIPLLKAVP